jgi:hypothetical protein
MKLSLLNIYRISNLCEIGDRVLYPNLVAGWGGGGATFSIDGVDYEIDIKLNDYVDVDDGIVEFPAISIAFNVVGQIGYKSTGNNVPYKIMSYVVGAVDSLPDALFPGASDVDEIRFRSLVFSSEDGRRIDLYKRVIENYCKRKNVDVETKKVSSLGFYRSIFSPYLSYKRR